MPISIEDVLGATEFRSMSRAGRMTESLSSKTRSAFHAKVSKKQLDRAAEDPSASPKPKSEKQALKLLSVAEVADVDATEVDKRVRAALPLDLVDERVDPLCSSGRDHPEVKAKAEMIVSLEKEIAFHKALEGFHGGVQTAASRASAEAVAVERTRKDREEATRRANALGIGPSAIDVEASPTDTTDIAEQAKPSSGALGHHRKANNAKPSPAALSPSMLAAASSSPKRAMTPAVAVSPLSNPTAANRCSSPAFAAKGDRFGSPSHELDRAPPVGHYRPRFTIVESTSPRSRFPKNRRVLNPAVEPAYRGDRMSPEERSLAETAAMSPARRMNLGGSASPYLNGTTTSGGGVNPNASGTFASIPSFVMPSSSLQQQKQPPATAPAAGQQQQQQQTRGRMSSPSFANRGRDAPVMTRGASTPAPGQQRSGSKPPKALSRRSQTPGFANDAAVRPRGPSAGLDFSRQIGREERERKSAMSGTTSEKIPDAGSMPLRDGSSLHKRGGGGSAFAFDGYASRDQVSRAKDRRPEEESQRFYDRSALDHVKFSRPTTVDFGRSPSRAQARSGMPASPVGGGESQGMADGPPPEKPRPHSPVFDMDRQTARPPIELQQSDLHYDVDDAPVRSLPRAAKIGTSAGHNPDVGSPNRSRVPRPAEQPRYLPSHEELDSPQVRRKLARSIDFGKSVDRDRATAAARDEPQPIPSERLSQAYDYLQPSKRGDPRIGTHVSRGKRDAVASSPALTSAVDHSIIGDDSNKPNLKLGYVSMGRMTERDRHTGNHFANESRTITKLFDKSPARGAGGSEQRKQRAAAAAARS